MISSRLRSGLTNNQPKSRMDRLRRITAPLICGIVFSVLVREVVSTPGIYLITPPSTNASPRSDNVDGLLEPAETLWIGSHGINWSPLPLFLKITNPGLYREKKQYAEERKYEPKTPTPIIVAKKSAFNSFSLDWNDKHKHTNHYSSHHPNRYPYPTGVGRFPDFPPRPQLPSPYLEGRSISNHNQQVEKPDYDQVLTSARSELQSDRNYDNSITTGSQPDKSYDNAIITGSRAQLAKSNYDSTVTGPRAQYQVEATTPSPMYVSTSATLLVSPPEAVAALSNPGQRIGPIVEKLGKMTEWSKQHHLLKKEGRPTPVYPFHDRKLRVKKRLISGQPQPKKYKNNIAEIIADNDNDTENNENGNDEAANPPPAAVAAPPAPSDDRSNIIKRKKDIPIPKNTKVTTRPKYDYEKDVGQYSYDDVFRPFSPRSDLVIFHPTNAAYLIKDDPMDGQQSRQKKHQLVRQEKKLDFFKKEGTVERPAPLSFRFGPEDARMSPYRY